MLFSIQYKHHGDIPIQRDKEAKRLSKLHLELFVDSPLSGRTLQRLILGSLYKWRMTQHVIDNHWSTQSTSSNFGVQDLSGTENAIVRAQVQAQNQLIRAHTHGHSSKPIIGPTDEGIRTFVDIVLPSFLSLRETCFNLFFPSGCQYFMTSLIRVRCRSSSGFVPQCPKTQHNKIVFQKKRAIWSSALKCFLKVASHMFVFSTHPTTNLYIYTHISSLVGLFVCCGSPRPWN
jgi:hypothetical protein